MGLLFLFRRIFGYFERFQFRSIVVSSATNARNCGFNSQIKVIDVRMKINVVIFTKKQLFMGMWVLEVVVKVSFQSYIFQKWTTFEVLEDT